jgi:hypothetical protein
MARFLLRSRRAIAKWVYVVLVVILVVAATVAVVVINSPKAPSTVVPADSLAIPSRGYYMGFLPSLGDGQTFEQVYSQASENAEIIPVWGRPTPFYNFASDLSGSWGNTFVETYVRGNGMVPLIHLSFIGSNWTLAVPPSMEDATLSDSAWRQAYETAALDVVRASKPLFLSLGNEVNRWYEKCGTAEGNPNGFQNFVSLYNEVYDEVKELSPQTNVFCTFAREIVPENREADLSVLSLFNQSKMDLLVFTSYPYAVAGINSPSDLPSDYYSRALNYMPEKPFGFSELAWTANDYFGGEERQAEFLTLASGNLTKEQGVNLRLLCWVWLHDLSQTDQVGLIKSDGSERMAYQVWKTLAHPS